MIDIRIHDDGTVVGFTPLTDAARDWIDENVESESWQWLGETLFVDHRMARPLAHGMAADGLEIG